MIHDYRDVAESLARIIAKGGKPLTKAQLTLMAGALAAWLEELRNEWEEEAKELP